MKKGKRLCFGYHFVSVLFLIFFFILNGCQKPAPKVKRLSVKERNLREEWSSGEFLFIRELPLNLYLSPVTILAGDFLAKGGKELLLYAASLPNLYILSPGLSLLEKLSVFSFPPKVFFHNGKDILYLSDGKAIFFFGKSPRGKLSRLATIRLGDNSWLKDFLITGSEGNLMLWTIEEREKGCFLTSWTFPDGGLRSEEKLEQDQPTLLLTGSSSGTVFLLNGDRIVARGRNNWESSVDGLRQPLRTAFSADGRTFFGLFQGENKSRLYAWRVATGEEISPKITIPLFNTGSFVNDFYLNDFDGDGQEEILLTYSGKEGRIIILKEGKIVSQKTFLPHFFYSRIVIYPLGVLKTETGMEIIASIRWEGGKTHPQSGELTSENYLYRLSPQLKVKEIVDLEDVILACAFLPKGLLLVGESFTLYRWE